VSRGKVVELKTNRQLQRLVKLWQKRLNLLDWTITAVFTSLNEDENAAKETLGTVFWDSDERIAEISVDPICAEVEYTLVHELVHVVNSGHTDYEGYDVNEERATNTIARALVIGYRGK
jgi:hypothetical protein